MHLTCRMQYFSFGRHFKEDSSLDSTTMQLESSCLRFLALFLWDFLVAAEDFFFGLQVFCQNFKENSYFFDGRVCVIETVFNHLFFHVVGMEW